MVFMCCLRQKTSWEILFLGNPSAKTHHWPSWSLPADQPHPPKSLCTRHCARHTRAHTHTPPKREKQKPPNTHRTRGKWFNKDKNRYCETLVEYNENLLKSALWEWEAPQSNLEFEDDSDGVGGRDGGRQKAAHFRGNSSNNNKN